MRKRGVMGDDNICKEVKKSVGGADLNGRNSKKVHSGCVKFENVKLDTDVE
jgi:hypothetical protein